MSRIFSDSEQETFAVGHTFGRSLIVPSVVLLYGELGTGKTVFIRGVCESLGVDQRAVRSPSFTLINQYTGRIPLFHVDLYRLHGQADLESIGLEEIIESEAVILVEWAERLEPPPPAAWSVSLFHRGGDRREIIIAPPTAAPV
ncbi:MAG: tRNA (adenosine(37)-N6)-threonylcarbamoyltransferase complex ATPase subunit type 1 TsaE [Acidobacteria bacterium]|nr:tRNA (adenosine(37)-N6)-threonylcarbamoyltransferase complex ATPase subunit type 1 TsaE [Acidobacteriota bacterium]